MIPHGRSAATAVPTTHSRNDLLYSDDYDARDLKELHDLYAKRAGLVPIPVGKKNVINSLRQQDRDARAISRRQPWNRGYERYSDEELQKFVRARTGGNNQTEECTREQFIALLRQLDKTFGLDLMGIPPEIRPIIFYHTVVGDETSVPRALLCASKQIRAEVEDVIYTEKPPRMNVHIELEKVKVVVRHVGLNSTLFGGSKKKADKKGLKELLRKAESLQHHRRLDIRIEPKLHHKASEDNKQLKLQTCDVFLSSLASIFAVGRLKQLNITFTGPFGSTSITTTDVQCLVRPFAILPSKIRLDTQGLPQHVLVDFSTLARSQPSPLVDWFRLKDEVNTVTKLAHRGDRQVKWFKKTMEEIEEAQVGWTKQFNTDTTKGRLFKQAVPFLRLRSWKTLAPAKVETDSKRRSVKEERKERQKERELNRDDVKTGDDGRDRKSLVVRTAALEDGTVSA